MCRNYKLSVRQDVESSYPQKRDSSPLLGLPGEDLQLRDHALQIHLPELCNSQVPVHAGGKLYMKLIRASSCKIHM